MKLTVNSMHDTCRIPSEVEKKTISAISLERGRKWFVPVFCNSFFFLNLTECSNHCDNLYSNLFIPILKHGNP